MYRSALLFLLIFWVSMLWGQSPWSGTYEGLISGVRSTLHLSAEGSEASGTINADGYYYQLQGQISDPYLSGQLIDKQNMATLPFQAALQGNQLTLQLSGFQIIFNRKGTATNPPGGAAGGPIGGPIGGGDQNSAYNQDAAPPPPGGGYQGYGNAPAQNYGGGGNYPAGGTSNPYGGDGSAGYGAAPGGTPSAGVPSSQLDQRLVGSWRNTQSYSSGDYTDGDFGLVSEKYLTIQSDGTYMYGGGQTVGGSNYGSFDSGQGDYIRGKWKVENEIIYVNEGNGWYAYAQYAVDASNLLFTFENGSKEFWERTR